MNLNKPIVLFDSGIGGLTVVKEVIEEMPNENIIYFADTAHLPYGPRSREEVCYFVIKIIEYFVNLGVKAVVIACNTANVAGLQAAQDKFEVSIIGPVELAAKAAVEETQNQKIGIIGTEGTIRSGAYQRKIKNLSKDVELFVKPCPELVTLIEKKGKIFGPEAYKVVSNCLNYFQKTEIDTLLLGCTHFPYLRPIIREIVGPDVTLIDSGSEIAVQIKNMLQETRKLNCQSKKGKKKFYASNVDEISYSNLQISKKYLGVEELSFEELNIFDE